jgi:hypothetical protein
MNSGTVLAGGQFLAREDRGLIGDQTTGRDLRAGHRAKRTLLASRARPTQRFDRAMARLMHHLEDLGATLGSAH